MTATPPGCPRCGASVAAGQEYCLGCGLRLPAADRLSVRHGEGRTLRLRALGLAGVALVGAALAIGLTRDATATVEVLTATGGSLPVKAPVETGAQLTPWPSGRDGWTIVLVSVPKVEGRDQALAVAEQARKAGLVPAGVLDSSRHASLRPGYWMAFQGSFASEAAANGALPKARRIARTARVQRVAG